MKYPYPFVEIRGQNILSNEFVTSASLRLGRNLAMPFRNGKVEASTSACALDSIKANAASASLGTSRLWPSEISLSVTASGSSRGKRHRPAVVLQSPEEAGSTSPRASAAQPWVVKDKISGLKSNLTADYFIHNRNSGAHLRIGAIIHRVTADLLCLQYKYVLRYAVDNNDFEGYPVICTNSQP
ncbi:MAG: hypothetical protein PHO37_16885 [Kiritimatiellae bacterium]|nr:hypothetical protein [Kiritimatiellia bacterium]